MTLMKNGSQSTERKVMYHEKKEKLQQQQHATHIKQVLFLHPE